MLGHKNHEGNVRATGPMSVVALKASDVGTPKMAQLVKELTAKKADKVVANSQRYTFHIDMLKAALTAPTVFHPSMNFSAHGVIYVTLDAADLSASPLAHCIALTNRTQAKFFQGPQVR